MKKRWKAAAAAILSCSMALAPFSGAGAENAIANHASVLSAEEGEKTDQETGFTYVIYGEGTGQRAAAQRAEITGYTGEEAVLAIPEVIGGREVGSIGDGAFKGNADITDMTIPEGVTRIGFEAFQGCENLASVTVPSTIADWSDGQQNSYDSSAFRGCTALAEVTLAEGLKVLGQRAFADCTALEGIVVPSTVEEFHNSTFSGCTALRTATLREGMEEIGYKAFAGCTALEQVEIPSTIKRWSLVRASGVMATVHDCAPFSGCTSLKKITFREGITTLEGFQGPRDCPLVEELDIPASVEDISYAFTNCTYLKKVTLHDGMAAIGTSAFQGCAALEEVRVPETVASVAAYAFRDCTSLERLVLPSAVTSLEGSITSGCTSLKELYLLTDRVKWYQKLDVASDGKLYCLEGSSAYSTYLSGMTEADRDKLAALPGTGASAEGFRAAYDGEAHVAAVVKGIQEGDEVLYRIDGGTPQKKAPEITEPGSYQIVVTVKRTLPGDLMRYSLLRAEARIQKREYAMRLSDLEAEEGEDYALAVQGYEGEEEPIYSYYKDEACTQACDGKPGTAGIYYVRADIPETDHDMAVRSNVAKITIRGKSIPGTNPPASQNPGTDPGTDPSASSEPGTDPGTDPSASQKPGTDPGTDPSAGQKPGTDPGNVPSASQKPGTDPGTDPGSQNGDSTGLAKGSVFTAGQLKYKVTSAAEGKAAVEVKAPKSRKAKSLTVPASVKKDGITYTVTSVGANAFKNCKQLKKITIGKNVTTIGKNAFSGAKVLKKITVKTTKLKKVGKNALKGIHKKAVIKVPKKKLKAYRKLWKKKGQKSTVKVK